MNFSACLPLEKCPEAGRAPMRPRGDRCRPAAAGRGTGTVARVDAHPQRRVQRGPGWVAVDSIALSKFR